jgi:hypothetical protein
MTFKGFRITGPKPGAYVLGDPIDVYDGQLHLGRLSQVSVSADGSELRLEDFITTDLEVLRTRRLARLLMVEILSFIVERHPSVSAIGIVLSADIDLIEGLPGGSAKLASVREQLLHSVGADNIRITPKPHPRHPAHFAVSGVWQYNRETAHILAEALRLERSEYVQRLAALAAAAKSASEANPPRSVLSRLLAKDR